MFTHVNHENPKLKLFLKYLANSYSKKRTYTPRNINFVKKDPETGFLEIRTDNLTQDRRYELETKIEMYYTKNRYLPFENRIKRIRKQVNAMGKSKKYTKKKVTSLRSKVNSCSDILKKIKKLDLPNF